MAKFKAKRPVFMPAHTKLTASKGKIVHKSRKTPSFVAKSRQEFELLTGEAQFFKDIHQIPWKLPVDI